MSGAARETIVGDLAETFGNLVEQLQWALEAHHPDAVQSAQDCDICRERSAALAQRYEQVDAVLERIKNGALRSPAPQEQQRR